MECISKHISKLQVHLNEGIIGSADSFSDRLIFEFDPESGIIERKLSLNIIGIPFELKEMFDDYYLLYDFWKDVEDDSIPFLSVLCWHFALRIYYKELCSKQMSNPNCRRIIGDTFGMFSTHHYTALSQKMLNRGNSEILLTESMNLCFMERLGSDKSSELFILFEFAVSFLCNERL